MGVAISGKPMPVVPLTKAASRNAPATATPVRSIGCLASR